MSVPGLCQGRPLPPQQPSDKAPSPASCVWSSPYGMLPPYHRPTLILFSHGGVEGGVPFRVSILKYANAGYPLKLHFQIPCIFPV